MLALLSLNVRYAAALTPLESDVTPVEEALSFAVFNDK